MSKIILIHQDYLKASLQNDWLFRTGRVPSMLFRQSNFPHSSRGQGPGAKREGRGGEWQGAGWFVSSELDATFPLLTVATESVATVDNARDLTIVVMTVANVRFVDDLGGIG
jgi:hypothetical protein